MLKHKNLLFSSDTQFIMGKLNVNGVWMMAKEFQQGRLKVGRYVAMPICIECVKPLWSNMSEWERELWKDKASAFKMTQEYQLLKERKKRYCNQQCW
jgi:hypothetical protein